MPAQYDPNKFTKGDVISPTRLRDKLNNMKVSADMMVEITHYDLVALRDDSKLVPGCQYRITDYVCSEIGTYYRSQHHQFDIIVFADGVNSINKHARATWHDGEDYFPKEDRIYILPDYGTDQYEYDGTIVVDGKTYYKWRNVGAYGDPDNHYDYYDWIITDQRTYPKTTYDGYYLGYKPAGGIYDDGSEASMSGNFAYLVRKYICYTEDDDTILILGDHNGDDEYPDPIYSSNMDLWELEYDIDLGDTGKITYMKDASGNEAKYDFKNIQFKRYLIESVDESSIENLIGRYIGTNIQHYASFYTIDSSDYTWNYTFGGSADITTIAPSRYTNNKVIGTLEQDTEGIVISTNTCTNGVFGNNNITISPYNTRYNNTACENVKIMSQHMLCVTDRIKDTFLNDNYLLFEESINNIVDNCESKDYGIRWILFVGPYIRNIEIGREQYNNKFVHINRPLIGWKIGNYLQYCELPEYDNDSRKTLSNVIILDNIHGNYDNPKILTDILDQLPSTSYEQSTLFTQVVGYNSNGEYTVKILLDNDDIINDSSISLSTTFSSSKIMQLVADAGFEVRVVRELPAEGEEKTIYMVPSSSTKNNIYYELIKDEISSDISIGDALELHEIPSIGDVITYTNSSSLDSSSIAVAASSSTDIDDIAVSDIGVITGLDPITFEEGNNYKITGIYDISDKLFPTAQSYRYGAKLYTYDDVTGVEPSDPSLTLLPCISTYRHDSSTNIKDEYIWTEGRWEMIGTTDIDLSDYYTKSETNVLLAEKSDTGHTHTKSEITDFEHTHVIDDITDFSITVAETIQILNALEPTILHLSGGAPDIEIAADQGELKSSQIPSGITIESVEIGEDVEVIGSEVFKYSDLSSVTIPNTVGYIDTDAFAECANLTSIDLPDSVFEISMGAFYNCYSLTSVNFGNGIEIINEGAFQDTAITSIVLPESIVEIHERAFSGCNITTATIKAITPPYIEQNEENLFGNSCIIYVPAESVSAYQSDAEWSVYGTRIQAIQTA